MQAFSCNLSPFSSPYSSSSSSCSTAASASHAAPAATASLFHSAEAPGRLPSAPAAAPPPPAAPAAAATVKPFDRELFRAFISAASRLFCDDEQIVVVDFLAHHEKAFTERELSDRLRWAEKRVREACAALEKLMLVAKEHLVPGSGSAASRKADHHSNDVGSFLSPAARGGVDGVGQQQQQTGSSAPCYYRVSPFCFLVFYYRLQRMEQQVESQRRNAETRDVFFCPGCRMQYDALEAQLLDVHPLDAHFLCKFCNERLEHEDSKLLLQQAISLQERCEKQLQVLKNIVRRGWNMQIPTFPPFTRAEKNQQKLKINEEEEEHKKRLATLQQDNASGQNAASLLKQQQAVAMLPNGSCSAPRAQPSWIAGTSGGRGGGEAGGGLAAAGPSGVGSTATAAGLTAAAGSDGKYAVFLCREGVSGGLGQLLNSKSATTVTHTEAAAGRSQQAASVGSTGAATAPGGRHQIKFAVKNTGFGGKSGSVLGSRLRAAQAMQHAGARPLDKRGLKTAAAPLTPAAATSSEAAENTAAGSAAAAVRPGGEATAARSLDRRESDNSSSTLPSLGTAATGATSPEASVSLQQQKIQEEAVKQSVAREDTAAAGVVSALEGADAAVQRDDSSATTLTAAAEIDGGVPLIYVSRLDREMSLEEAAEYQQEMTSEEHEKFMELQAMYIDEI